MDAVLGRDLAVFGVADALELEALSDAFGQGVGSVFLKCAVEF